MRTLELMGIEAAVGVVWLVLLVATGFSVVTVALGLLVLLALLR